MPPAWVLAIGGRDPSRGAGLTADRAAVEARGLELREVCTAETDQDDAAVRSVGEREAWRWQYEALSAVSIENPVAVKFGLLPSAESVRAAQAVVDQLRFDAPELPMVLDPVLASSSGFRFLDDAGVAALLDLSARPMVWTPNRPEAARLLGVHEERLSSPSETIAAAGALLERGLRAVVLTDGHGGGERLEDLLWERGGEPTWISRPRARTASGQASMRGTGCRFASGLAAELGMGRSLDEAVRRAGDWVAEAIAAHP